MVFELGLWQVRDKTFSLGVNQGGHNDGAIKPDMWSEYSSEEAVGSDPHSKMDMRRTSLTEPLDVGIKAPPGRAPAEFPHHIAEAEAKVAELKKESIAELNEESIAVIRTVVELKKERIAALNEEGAVEICTTVELNEKSIVELKKKSIAELNGKSIAELKKECIAGTPCSRKNSKRQAKKKEQARKRHLAEVAEDAAQSHIRSIAAKLRIVGEHEEEKAAKAFRESQVQAKNVRQVTRKKARAARKKAWQESPSVARRYAKRLKQWALKYLKVLCKEAANSRRQRAEARMKRITTEALQTRLKKVEEETNNRSQRQEACRVAYDSKKRQCAARNADPVYRCRVIQLQQTLQRLIQQMQRARGGELLFGGRHSLDLPGITDAEAMFIIEQQDSAAAEKATRLEAAEKEHVIHMARYYWKDNDIFETAVVRVHEPGEGPAVVMEPINQPWSGLIAPVDSGDLEKGDDKLNAEESTRHEV